MSWGIDSAVPGSRDILCGDFFPVIPTGKFYENYRIPVELPEATVVEQLQQAVIRVRRALKMWRLEQDAAKLSDIPQEAVDGVSELVLLWQRAVYCEAKAEILRETMTADRRKDAENAMATGAETEDKYREFAADAIAAITGSNSTTISMI